MDPYLDDARNDLTQDLAYSQALIKIGHIRGSGKTQEPKAGESSGEGHYSTDGLRVVLVFGDRPASLASIDFFNGKGLLTIDSGRQNDLHNGKSLTFRD